MQGIPAPFRGETAGGAAGLDRDFHHRLFAGKAPPVEKARPFDVPAIRKDFPILHQLEHHANIVPWQMVAKEKGTVLRVIPITDRGEIMLEQYEALLGPRTKLVTLAHASNSLGTMPAAAKDRDRRRRQAIDGLRH